GSRRCRPTTRRCAARTSLARARCSAGSPRSTSRRGCGAGSRPGGANRRVSRRLGGVLAAVTAAAVLCVPAATAAPHMLVGMLDDANTLGEPATTFPILKTLNTQVVRMTLNWRAVARSEEHTSELQSP